MAPISKPDTPREHPIVAWVSILAIVAVVLLIVWARFEVHGTQDLESALTESRSKPSPDADKNPRGADVDDAVAAGRWATGVTP